MKETRSTCPYCGVGCGVIIESEGAQITGVRGDPDHPANFGRLCTKGSTLALTASAPITQQTRLLQPMRREHRAEKAKVVSWDSALDFAATSFAQIIQEHGPDSIGFYISGQLLTEDYYVFNKLVKGQIGTNNVDTNSRLCMSSAVAGYKQTLGADAPPACYDDVNHASCILIVGSNTAYAHPILFRRIEEAKKNNPELKIIFADPRKTDTTEIADLYLPLLPGTDVALFNGMLHIMLWEGWINADYIAKHTNGFDDLKTLVREYTPESVAQTCGIKKEDLFAAAKLFATSPATLSLYCQGLNQSSSGTAKNASLINLHLATAQIGKPGAGPFSLTGQPNAMGGREVGGLANLISAHRDMANPAHRAEVAALWGLKDVPSTPGKTAVEMFQAAADGQIKALWIACTNPAQSMPDQALVRQAMERAEIVVLQEAFVNTETARYADLLLPATTWGEKEGTVTNSERRITRVRAAVPAPGEARHDWQIIQDFGQRLEKLIGVRTQLNEINRVLTPINFLNYASPEQVWEEHKTSTAGRDLDITGLSYTLLDQSPQQWPFKAGDTQGKQRLYEDGIYPTADGKAKFVAHAYKPVAEPRESRYPFSLTTGRLRDHWHGMSRTGALGRLFGHVPEPVVQMNVQDMSRRLLKEGDLVHVTSKRGSLLLPVQASSEVNVTQAFIAMHWGSEFLSGRSSTGQAIGGVNAITTSSYCPISKQPELKHAAVKILKAELPWNLLAVAWLPASTAHTVRAQLQELMASFEYASCVPFGREDAGDGSEAPRGILFRAAANYAPKGDAINRIETLLGLNSADTLRYEDKKRGQRRTARLVRIADAKARLQGFVLAGDVSAEAWIKTLLQDQLDAETYGRLLLSPGAKAPIAIQAKGNQVCSCFNVSESEINDFLRTCAGNDAEQLGALQTQLKCGTNCGSCVPQLKKIIRLRQSSAELSMA
ncbi:nitrate reductase [Variovorax sp. PCZ-1]|uniref:nitrate reductase n=1 Tax=Variovorax sp. PCZ-1 TaxID=2835533 RepID=UPI001BCB7BB9|nr:nitrate reductase [Variovorax sp. PCZ-1]MBS7806816.1 molybdopterin-dependent oxidoreductase [Variovorax sp. PCZ-1]